MDELTRLERYKLLCIFGDAQPHNWFQTIVFGVAHLEVRQSKFERLLNRACEYGLIRRCGIASNPKDDSFEITPKGDQCLREEQIARGGDHSYYSQYDRSLYGTNGAQKFAPIPAQFSGKNGYHKPERKYFSI